MCHRNSLFWSIDMSKINPNSSIRSGYTYEDLHVLKHCVDWLLNPRAYTQIQIQFTPDLVKEKYFAIDDVVVTRTDGITEYFQLKHRQHPERDLWDFGELKTKGVFKWIRSYLALIKLGPTESSLQTNGNISADIIQCLSDCKLDKRKVANVDPDFYKELTDKFSEEDLESFFMNFDFKFNQPGIQELESTLREILYKELKVTKAGVDSLLLYIASQGRARFPKTFTLEEIRSCLSWDNPRPLNQNFEIPDDFEFFDREFHEKLLFELKDSKGGIKVFTGKPGCGKSTYLSKLFSTLKKNGIMVFRHHYHLNPKDSSFAERLNSDRVKESLKAEFKKQNNSVIKELGEINTEYTDIKEFIDRIAEYHRHQGTAFVLIIDGLDHVIREGKNRDALVSFLNDIIFPQEGFWVIFGTQEMATPCFPRIVEQYAPKSDWTEIKGLNRTQVAKIARKAFPDVARKHKEYFRESTDALYELTAGNPLHLRYVITEISNNGRNLSSYDLRRIKPYGNNISNYYAALWNSLSELAQSLCYAITALDFKLHKEQLFSLAAHLTKYPADVSIAYKDVSHLIRIELSGISVYHNSFQVFMNGQPELKEQQTALYRVIREWLQNPAQESLRWAESAKIEYYLNNPAPLLSLSHDWIINSYLDCRDEFQIQKLLDLAAKAAFENKLADKVIYFSVVSSYFANRTFNMAEALNTLWITSFRSKPNLAIPYPDFSKLTHYQVKEILISLKNRGIVNDIPLEAMERMNELYKDRNSDQRELTLNWIEVLVAFPDIPTKKAFNFLKQFRKSGEASTYFSAYLNCLLADEANNRERIDALLRLRLKPSERVALLQVFMQRDMLSGSYQWIEVITRTNLKAHRMMNFYSVYSGLRPAKLCDFPSQEEFPNEYEYYSSSKSIEIIKLFERTFDAAFFNALAENKTTINEFLNNASERWPVKLAKIVARIASTLGRSFSEKKRIKLHDVLQHLEELPELDFSYDFKIYELRRAVVPYIIEETVWLTQVTNIRNGNQPELTKAELDLLFHHKWYYQNKLFDLVQSKLVSISDEALDFFLEQQLDKLQQELIPFKDKAESLVGLTLLYKDFQNGVHLPKLLYLTAENILAYGYHKDMFMHDIIESIEVLIDSGSSETGEYLNRLMPFVYYIEELTDGDETRHFISAFYLLVARYDIQLLYNFYFHRLDTREYLDSDILWTSVLKTLDLNNPVSFALACTAIDHSGFSTISSENVNPKMTEVIADIHSKFGGLNYSKKESNSPSYKRENSNDKSYTSVIPGSLAKILSDRKEKEDFTKFDEGHFINLWAKFWLRKLPNSTLEILKEIKSVLGDKPWDVGKETLNILYPYALKVDKALAFDCLCWQMIAIGGWNSNYMLRMEDARAVWREVNQSFPDRREEFYQWTVSNSGLRYGDQKNYSIPIPKSIQFFVDAGQIQRAEEYVTFYLDTLASIFPNVALPVPEFWTKPKEIKPFDLLLRRLEWMSPLVKSTAAEKISELLRNDKSGEIHSMFYSWLESCKLESIACYGLLVIIRSLQNQQSLTFKHLGQLRLGTLLKIRCMATDLLLERIAEILKVPLYIDRPLVVAINSAPPKIDLDHFKNLIGRNLTLSYLDFLDDIEDRSPFSVWRAWLCMYKERCEEMGLVYQSEDEEYENRGTTVMIGRNTIFAEILKSTFFKIIDSLYDMGLLDIGTFFRLTLKILPIDYSIWEVSPQRKPEWWPKYHVPLIKSGDAHPDLSEELNQAFIASGDNTILSMNAVFHHGEDFYSAETYYVQKTIAFAYPSNQTLIENADQIYDQIHANGFLYPKIRNLNEFGSLDNDLGYSARNRKPAISGLQPLTAQLNIPAHHIWEYYRIFNPFILLHPLLGSGLRLEPKTDGIFYFSKERPIAKAADFMSGLRETFNHQLHLIPHSNYLVIDNAFFKDILQKNNMQFAYIVKEEFYYKTDSYRDEWPKPYVTYRIISNT